MIYGLYFINLLEEDLISLTKSVNISDYVSSRNYTKKNNPNNPIGSHLNKLAGIGMRRRFIEYLLLVKYQIIVY